MNIFFSISLWLYKEKLIFNNTDVWRFDLFIEEKKEYNDNVFPYRYDLYKQRKRQLLNNSVFRFSDVE